MKIKNSFNQEEKAEKEIVKENVEKSENNHLEKVAGELNNQQPTSESTDRVVSPMAGGGK